MNLILDMKRLGHPSFAHLDEAGVRERAQALPEHGVPAEVLQVIEEETANEELEEDKLQPQKQAAPREPPAGSAEAAGKAFAAQRPRVVLAEGRSAHDAQQAAKGALDDLMAELAPPGAPASSREESQAEGVQTLEVRAGNQLLDQFFPGYWSAAFSFLFKHGTAEPDVQRRGDSEAPLSRRKARNPAAPEVGIQDWAAALQRQVASQFRRDWNFTPALWNYVFRTIINLQPNSYMYATVDSDTGLRRMLTPAEIEKGAREIHRLMEKGIYVDVSGGHKAVNGDLLKVKYVPNLSPAAKKVLANMEARTKKVPGTHEVRTIMRNQTNANRVVHGLAQFITFSPSERDTAIMLRMVRARQSDPAIEHDGAATFYRRETPDLEVDYMRLSPERLAEAGVVARDLEPY